MSEIKLTINGKLCTGTQGETILAIAERGGIVIPTLCHNDTVAHYGACGLCVVECEGTPKLLRSCSTLATDGMVINTEGARVRVGATGSITLKTPPKAANATSGFYKVNVNVTDN